jgi:rhomboid protease GluP
VVTNAITVALVAVAAAIALAIGPSNDVGVLARAGALVKTFVNAGEWWRLVTCIFIHVGALHLLLNATGMYVLGRLAEDVFGRARTLAVFGASGIAGAVASFMAVGALSAGASGAVFGVLGAVFVEITWHRARYQQAWKRGMWGGLAIVTLAQLGYGFAYPIVDQWAHGAGLGTGALLGYALSPHARWAKLGGHVARALAAGFVAISLVAGAFAVATSSGDSLGRLPTARQQVGRVSVEAPVAWHVDGDEIRQTDVFIMLRLEREPGPLAGQIATRLAGEPDRARAKNLDQIDAAIEPVVPLPPGWEGRELASSATDDVGSRQQYRIVVAGVAIGGEIVIASLYVPEAIARSAPSYFTELLASVR